MELRERAAGYKKRAEGVNIRHLLPLTRQDLAYRSNSPSTSSPTTPSQTTPSSPTPSDSVSCTVSDCPHHVKGGSRPSPLHALASPVLNVADPSSCGGLKVQDIEEEKNEEVHHTPTPPPETQPHPLTITQPSLLETDEQAGRVQTPTIQKSFSDYRRHHLDRTTPVAGGLFMSPQKKQLPEVILPYPPLSPKYRRDMKSSAPISPAPKSTKDECVQVEVDFSQSSASSSPPVGASPTPKQPQSVPASSSPYHTQCVPGNKPKSSSVRKLDFKQSHAKVSASKPVPKSYSYRVQGHTSSTKANCDICGAHLKPTPVSNIGTTSAHSTASKPYTTQSPNIRSSFAQSTTSKLHTVQRGVTSGLANGGVSSSKKPQVTVLSSQPYTSQRLSSTNYMTRLLPYSESRPKDFDESSFASLSLSSCSVASDLLRKAQERRDHFWRQPPHVTAT